jgi:hypothetical protein
VALESHAVEGQTFADALRVERSQVFSFAGPDGGPPFIYSTNSTDWYAPGFGLIESAIDSQLSNRTYSYKLVGARVDGVSHGAIPMGTLVDVSSPSGGDRPAVASDGTRFLLVQTTATSTTQGLTQGGLRLIFVGADGMAQSATSLSTGNGAVASPLVTYGNGRYLVMFTATTGLRGLFVSATDATAIGAPFDIASSTFAAAVAFGQGVYVVANIQPQGQSQGVFTTVIDGQGNMINEIQPYPSTTQRQGAPAIAFDGKNFLLVWQAVPPMFPVTQPVQIQAGRVNKDGNAIDVQITPVSALALAQEQASVVFDGSRYDVTWFDRSHDPSIVDEGQIFAARIGTDGVILDPGGHLIPTMPRAKDGLQIGRVGSQAVIVWYATAFDLNLGVGLSAHMVATRLDANGISIDSSPTQEGLWISSTDSNSGELQLPALTAAGDRSLLVYVDRAGESSMVRRFGHSLLFPW